MAHTFRVDLRAAYGRPTHAHTITGTGLSFALHIPAENAVVAVYRGEHATMTAAITTAHSMLTDAIVRAMPLRRDEVVITQTFGTIPDDADDLARFLDALNEKAGGE